MRAMGLHHAVHAINEPHFWERLYLPNEKGRILAREEQIELLNRLICSQRQAFQVEDNPSQYSPLSTEILEKHEMGAVDKLALYSAFLKWETDNNGKTLSCEKTPRNVFYAKELLDSFENALVVVINRDPRAVMLSQKNKWKRRRLGSTGVPLKEQIRLWLNYHPMIMSKLWSAGVAAGQKVFAHKRVLTIRFEDFIDEPEPILRDICQRLSIDFDSNMLNVPQKGSSTERDNSEQTGFRERTEDSWRNLLGKTEIAISDKFTREQRKALGYKESAIKSNPVVLAYYYLQLPIKLSFALFFNFGRYKNLLQTLKNRW